MDTMGSQIELASGREALLSGDPFTAVAILEPLVAREPGSVEARYWLASAKLTAGDPNASAVMDEARILQTFALIRTMGVDAHRCRNDAAYGADIATRLYGRDLVAMSGVIRALSLSKGEIDAGGLLSYGLALQHQGRVEEACQVIRVAAENFPSAHIHQFQLYPLLMCDDGDARFAEEARAWARLYAPVLSAEPHRNSSRAGRKLRIGYLAPGFASTQVRQFIAPLLEQHDRAQVSVMLYPATAATEVDWPSWIEVHPLGHLDDAEAAALIRRDEIDVLADCWGHSAGSRLTMLARRPAPIQVSFINFVQTTGLEQVDYVLHADADGAPPVEGHFTEGIWRIGPVFNAFRPSAGRPPAVPSPMSKTGEVTFGSFNHPVKLSDWTIDAWSAILRQAPTARLLLKYRYFDDPVLQRVTQARFAARGVPPERLDFAGHSSGEDYFRSFGDVDLMLDAWPAPGSTTTLDALSNGVPVLGLDRPTIAGHYTRSILSAAGLPELIASDADDFVARAIDLTKDAERLDALRARVRPGFEQGPLCDGLAYARRIEAAFAAMFDQWRRDRQPTVGAA
jgi:protein O-GlcNAc transferase